MSDQPYRELRVPTTPLEAEVLCADGRTFRGCVFMPSVAAHHTGPMRPVEWMNDATAFFPFLPVDSSNAVLLNRNEVLAFTVSAHAVADVDDRDGDAGPRRRVVVECRDRRFEGEVIIDMPSHQNRLLDYLNRGDAFLIVLDGDRHHLIRKARITRVLEPKES